MTFCAAPCRSVPLCAARIASSSVVYRPEHEEWMGNVGAVEENSADFDNKKRGKKGRNPENRKETREGKRARGKRVSACSGAQ